MRVRQYLTMFTVLVAFWLSMALMIAGDVWVAPHYNLRGPVLALRLIGAAVAAPLCGLPLIVVAWLAMGKSPLSQRLGAVAAIWLMSAPGVFFAIDAANVVLDDSTPRVHVVRFIKTRHDRRNNSVDVVSWWRDPSETVAFTTTLPVRARPGQLIELKVHRGRLGYEYVTAPRLANKR